MSNCSTQSGWVKLPRTLLDHPLMLQLPAAWFRVYVAILLKVNWKANRFWDGSQHIEVQPGSLITSLGNLAEAANVSVAQVRGCFFYFRKVGIATIVGTSRYSRITLLDSDIYQGGDIRDPKVGSKPAAEPRQAANKPPTTIKDANQKSLEDGENLLDTCSASRKQRAKAAQGVGRNPFPQGKNLPNEEGPALLRTVMMRHFNQTNGSSQELLAPSEKVLDTVLQAISPRSPAEFARYLEALPAKYQAGGKNSPRSWGWFITVARDWAQARASKTPTADRCAHDKPYGVCCNAPGEFDEMLAALELAKRLQ